MKTLSKQDVSTLWGHSSAEIFNDNNSRWWLIGGESNNTDFPRWRQLQGTFSTYCVDTVSIINVKIDKLYCYSCYLYSENVSVTVFSVRALRDVQLPRLLGDAEQPIADQYC